MKFPLSVVLLGGLVLLPVRLDAQTLQVTHNVNLRSDPSTEHPSLGLLRPPLRLTQLQPDQEDGYYFVRTPVGEEGWVWAKNVRLVTEPEAGVLLAGATSSFDPTWDKPEPNKSTFTNVDGKVCGFGGEGDEVAQNQRKNRTDVPTSYHDVTFDALASLPYPTPAPKHRSDWTVDQLNAIKPNEGVAVRVVGYLVAIKPQTGSQESTNCYMTRAAETDWHMALVEQPGQGEDQAVVIETTPRIRRHHPKWTKTRLLPWLDTPEPIRISGWTMLDPEHRNHLNTYRSTLWEVHPILKIEVSQNGHWVDADALPH